MGEVGDEVLVQSEVDMGDGWTLHSLSSSTTSGGTVENSVILTYWVNYQVYYPNLTLKRQPI